MPGEIPVRDHGLVEKQSADCERLESQNRHDDLEQPARVRQPPNCRNSPEEFANAVDLPSFRIGDSALCAELESARKPVRTLIGRSMRLSYAHPSGSHH